MTKDVDLFKKSPMVASIRFPWSPTSATYDYLIPEDITLSAGDKAVVRTKRGEADVEVVEVKETSDKATAWIVRKGK